MLSFSDSSVTVVELLSCVQAVQAKCSCVLLLLIDGDWDGAVGIEHDLGAAHDADQQEHAEQEEEEKSEAQIHIHVQPWLRKRNIHVWSIRWGKKNHLGCWSSLSKAWGNKSTSLYTGTNPFWCLIDVLNVSFFLPSNNISSPFPIKKVKTSLAHMNNSYGSYERLIWVTLGRQTMGIKEWNPNPHPFFFYLQDLITVHHLTQNIFLNLHRVSNIISRCLSVF